MKYVLFICGFLTVVGLLPKQILAQSTTTATTSASSTAPVVETPAPTNRPVIEPRALTAAAQTRLINLAANVSNRLDAYVRRITNVTDRLESRANKMSENGLDVTAARGKIAEARAELEKARQSLTNIDTAVNNFVKSENPRTYWQQVKATYMSARDAIKAAHRATVETLLLLKTTSAPAPTASSTTTSTNDVE
jgi:Mg2+ and Co2+ transporter CorA